MAAGVEEQPKPDPEAVTRSEAADGEGEGEGAEEDGYGTYDSLIWADPVDEEAPEEPAPGDITNSFLQLRGGASESEPDSDPEAVTRSEAADGEGEAGEVYEDFVFEHVIIEAVQPSFEIFTSQGAAQVTMVVCAETTVDELKAQIADTFNVSVDDTRLTFGGADMEDGRTLADYNLKQNSSFNTLVRGRGGVKRARTEGRAVQIRELKDSVVMALARIAANPNASPVIDAAVQQVNVMMEEHLTPFTRIVTELQPEERAKLLKITATTNDFGTRVKRVSEILCGLTIERLSEVETQCKHMAAALRGSSHYILLKQFGDESTASISWDTMMQVVMDAPAQPPAAR